MICHHVPRFQDVLPELYNKTKLNVVRAISRDLECSSDDADLGRGCPAFSFTTDCWTSSAMDPYSSFTLSYLSVDFSMHAVALENKPLTGSHTADVILIPLKNQWRAGIYLIIFQFSVGVITVRISKLLSGNQIV